ncbi:Rhomboid domain-containing protein [Cephalotus follicularis]|uniref:RHOMBOID-like protein n=1 Tax=Cephalotus follicularis TaxID=3775 RepID=A0A1Q3AUQ4_CEPFO|nr:Rhomboid domain-containing protein [Cephalotus follicularis]
METPTKKPHTEIDMKPPPPPPPCFDFHDYPRERCKIPVFRSRSGRSRTRDTWIIVVFVLLYIAAFIYTMVVNNCGKESNGDCAIKAFGRVSFQPLYENPLLGPSASTLDKVGALRRIHLTEYGQTWRLFVCPWLHAGAVHLIMNLGSILFIGLFLEKEFGSLRVGIIYILSAFVGSLVTAIFVRNSPAVASSGALFGLLGAMLSGLIQNWKIYTHKFAALVLLFFLSAINLALGLLPYVDNFSNIGGFISGLLLGLVLFFNPELRQLAQTKAGLFEDNVKSFMKFKLKLDRPVLRIVSLLLFGLVFAGCLVAVLRGININQYCGWCRYINCVPSKRWSCNEITASCETMASDAQMTLTCMANGNFKIFPYINISEERITDLCTLICS